MVRRTERRSRSPQTQGARSLHEYRRERRHRESPLFVAPLHRKAADAGSQCQQRSPKDVLGGYRLLADPGDHVTSMHSRFQRRPGVQAYHQAARSRWTADRGVRPQDDHATRRVQRFFDRIIERAAVLNLAVPPGGPAVTFEPVREKTGALAVRRRVADEDVRHGSHAAFVAPGAILRQEGEARRAVLRSAPRTTCGTSAASDTQTGSTVLRTTARDPSWRLAPAFR